MIQSNEMRRTSVFRRRLASFAAAQVCVAAILIGAPSLGSACTTDDCTSPVVTPMVLPSGPAQLQAGKPVSRPRAAQAARKETPPPVALASAAEPTPDDGVSKASATADSTAGAAPDVTPAPVLRRKRAEPTSVVKAGPKVAAVPANAVEPLPAPAVVEDKSANVAVATPAEHSDEPMASSEQAAKASTRSRKPPAPKTARANANANADLFAPEAIDASGVAGYRTDLESLKPAEVKAAPKSAVPTSLSAAVLTAISDNALIKVSEGGALDALAGIGVAEVGLYPQVDGRLGTGISGTGDWQQPRGSGPLYNRKNAYGAGRGDVSLSAQQVLYDFGATRSGISRAAAFTEAQNFSVLQTIEDVAYRTAEAYLKVLQERQLVDLADENLNSLKEIADLVSENQRNGNGTVADVKRVNARVIDAASAKADETLALKLVSDQLRRLIRVDPARLGPAPTLAGTLPPDETKALKLAETTNPGILAYKASIQSRESEIASIRSGRLPKLTAEIVASNKQYQAVNDKAQFDGSAMLGLSYKFYDGGLAAAQVEQVRARMLQDEMRMRDARETIESDLRQNYFTIRISRDKSRSLAEGVDLNEKARSLYREQFRGGKRSLLELLEVQSAYYLSKRAQLSNQYEERRSTYLILRSLGRFTVAALRTR